jgi:hypothetical protein
MRRASERAAREGPPRNGQHPAKDAAPRSASTVALPGDIPHQAACPRLKLPAADLGLAYAVAREANRLSAEQRDAECRCPGRAYVLHAPDLAVHRDGYPAGYAWVSVADALDVLSRLRPRTLARLAAGIS